MLTSSDMALCGLEPPVLFAPVANCQTIGLAVSGGADSLALMLLYAAWKGPKPNAIVYTVDHRLRPEAQREAAMVVSEAEKLRLPCRPLVWDGPKPSSGKQSAARSARYRLMAGAMAADGARVLLTAHHIRDQAETVLMRLAHGSGVTGLAGMRAFSEIEGVNVFRPLLGVRAETLATLVARAGLSPAHDPSNADPAYERTRWRNALPALGELGITPETIGRLAGRLARIDDFANRSTDRFIKANVTRDGLGMVRVGRAALANADPEIAIRIVDRAVAVASGAQTFTLARIERVAERLAAGERFSATLAGACISAQGDAVVIYREVGRQGLPSSDLAPGDRLVWDGRFSITATRHGTIGPASGLSRARFTALTGERLEGPVAGLRAAPLICDADGQIAAIGCFAIAQGFAVGQIPLTA